MITRPGNWNEVQEFADRPKLPAGAYVCKIRQTTVQACKTGDQLCVLIDIAEGEFSGFYDNDFRNSTLENKKWGGVLRLWLPLDNGTEQDEWTKSTFKGFINAVEHSNSGYTWNWDERSLAGKMIGVLFRNEEWDYEGKHGWKVRPFRAMSVDRVRDGDFTIPADKPLSGSASHRDALQDRISAAGFTEIENDDDFPF